MDLNQFSTVDIVLDKANDNIIQRQTISAGDRDGRSLTLQVTNEGSIGEVPGLTANLLWTNHSSNLSDLSAFSVVDRLTSVFKINYPQNMLTAGKVTAQIQLLHNGKVTHSKKFEIIVLDIAGKLKGVLQSAEYTALVEALAKANEFETEIAEVTAQLAQNMNFINNKFIDMLQASLISSVHLYGDSISEGVGATGHISPPPATQPLIFDDGTYQHYEGDYKAPSFANYFRNYLATDFPNVNFVNKGIGGKSAKWGNTNKKNWVTTGDVAFIMLGTNDRWDSATLTEFKTNLSEFVDYVQARYTHVILMTATPSLTDYNQDGTINTEFNFGMREVDRIITLLAKEKGLPHISHYRHLIEFSRKTGVPMGYLVQNYSNPGSHPVDSGHYQIWKQIQEFSGFTDTLPIIDKYNYAMIGALTDTSSILTTTPITDSRFIAGKLHIAELSLTNTDLINYPDGLAGTLLTYKGFNNDLYSWQEYRIRQSNKTYKRYWDYANSIWTEWQLDSGRITGKEILTVAVGTVAANTGSAITVPITQPLSANYLQVVSARSPLPNGIYMESAYNNTTSIVLRFRNVTAEDITVGNITIAFAQIM